MHTIITPPPMPRRDPAEPWTADSLARELIWQDYSGEPWRIVSERRLLELEEAVCSRRARRRLRRQLRQRTARFAWAGESFTARRMEDVGDEALNWRDLRGGAR